MTGGQPIYGGSHDQQLVVKMYREGDPASANAVPARNTLGPDWQKLASHAECKDDLLRQLLRFPSVLVCCALLAESALQFF